MLYGFGYSESYTSPSTQTVVSSYIDRKDHNILVVEWSNYSAGNYLLESIPNAHKIGELVGKALLTMRDQGFHLGKFHLVGHSLGGHLVGFIGRSVSTHSKGAFNISRITALDPAGPFFTDTAALFTDPLRNDDGNFVDVVHTDSTFFGTTAASGTADFWPNAGKDQPGCPPGSMDISNIKNFCSHFRSWEYFSESVRSVNLKSFESVSCASWDNFTKNQCGRAKTNYMGINADPHQTGNFYLRTNSQTPYNRGKAGILFKQGT